MSAHIEPQIIKENGKPAFAVIPWEQFQELMNACRSSEADEADVWFPNDVVKANVRGESLIKAWRNHFELTQIELAEKAGIKQSALARLENADTGTIRSSTLKKLAEAMGISAEQLID